MSGCKRSSQGFTIADAPTKVKAFRTLAMPRNQMGHASE